MSITFGISAQRNSVTTAPCIVCDKCGVREGKQPLMPDCDGTMPIEEVPSVNMGAGTAATVLRLVGVAPVSEGKIPVKYLPAISRDIILLLNSKTRGVSPETPKHELVIARLNELLALAVAAKQRNEAIWWG